MALDIKPNKIFEYTQKSTGRKVIYLGLFINKASKTIDITEVFKKFRDDMNGNK